MTPLLRHLPRVLDQIRLRNPQVSDTMSCCSGDNSVQNKDKEAAAATVKEDSQKKSFKRVLVKYKDLPEYLKDNEFILDYYRCEWPLKDILLSIFTLHNETLNIWTHLGGFFIFVGLTVISCADTKEFGGLLTSFSRTELTTPLMETMMDSNVANSSLLDNVVQDSHWTHLTDSSVINPHKEDVYRLVPRWPWFVFLAGAMGCLVCSSISHLFACHSKSFSLFFWRLDYAGISLMIVCSFFAPIYYAFFCHPNSRFFYLTSITVLGILAIVTLLSPALLSPRFRSFRASLFLTMGVYGIVPAAHAIALNWGQPQVFVSLGYELVMGILYAIGAGFYVSRIPERWKPGAFDIAGHSHQIFHVFVVAGALAHCAGTLSILDYRQKLPACIA